MRDTDRARERQRHRPREKQAPWREPKVGLDPGSPGSRPKLKADTQPLGHPSVPTITIFIHHNSGHCNSIQCTKARKGNKTHKYLK